VRSACRLSSGRLDVNRATSEAENDRGASGVDR
jgi:hypothetical protein